MATSMPLGEISCPSNGNNEETIQAEPEEQATYFNTNTTTAQNRSKLYVIICVTLVIGLCICIVCAFLNISVTNSSNSSTNSSILTFYNSSTYLPTSINTKEGSWTTISTDDYNQKHYIPMTDDDNIRNEIIDEIVNSINTSVDPCENFYNYACQGWQKKNPIPDYISFWSVPRKLKTKNTKRVIRILENPDENLNDTPLNLAKLFYKNCVQIGNEKSEMEDKAAIQLMWQILENFGGWPILYENETWNKYRFNWISSVVALRRQFKSIALLNVLSYQVPVWMTVPNTILIKSPSSLELIDYFVEWNKLSKDSKYLKDLQNLIVNISKVFLEFQGKKNINETHLESKALDLLLTRATFPGQGDPFNLSLKDRLELNMKNDSNLAHTSLDNLQSVLDKNMLPLPNQLNLSKLLKALNKNTNVSIQSNESLVIFDINYLFNLAKFVTESNDEILANYLGFRMILLMIPLSGHGKLMNLLNDFENILKGTSGKKPRNEICAEVTQNKFQVAVGHAFVKDTNPNELEFEQAKLIFENLKVSIQKLINSSDLPYLDKPFLETKLESLNFCLGYPSWMNETENDIHLEYSGLVINKSATYLEQSMTVNMWAVDKYYGLLSQKLENFEDDDDANCQWTEFAGDVGPNIDVMQETIYIPLGILQLPFYSIFMPMSLIYGKLGVLFGHEIIHGLTGYGWGELENGTLTLSAQCLVDQYGNFSVTALIKENVTLDGLKTLEENMADNAGLLGAYKAFKKLTLLDESGIEKVEGLKDFTDEQLFFLGFAQDFCESSNEIYLRNILEKDYHSPGMFRVLGSLQNSKEFAKAWKCPKGSKMNPFPENHEKCKMF